MMGHAPTTKSDEGLIDVIAIAEASDPQGQRSRAMKKENNLAFLVPPQAWKLAGLRRLRASAIASLCMS